MTSLSNPFSAVTAALKPWADLAKSHTEAQVAHVKAVSAILADGVNQQSLAKLTDLTRDAAAQHMVTATNAFRLHAQQSSEVLSANLSKAGLSSSEFVKKVHADVASAHETFTSVLDKVAQKISSKKV